MTGYRSTQMIFAAASLGIADLLQDGPKSSGELAILTKSHPESLYRLLRGLASLGIFEEQDDKFALTPSALNLSSHSEVNLAPFALSYGQPWWWIAFGNLTESVQTGIPAFELAHGVSFFSYLNAHPEAAKIFNSNMTAMTKPSAISISKHFDFSTSETVCDIGGGHGILLKTIKEHFPNIKPILFDQPAVVRKADLGPDFTIVPGSFFDSVPPGADLYILKDIIHDWDDARSIQILQNCVTAMKQTSRLLIIERVVPPGNGYSDAKLVDITMLALTGGLERTLKQFEDLFAVVGLKLSKTFELPSSVAILEITLK